MSRARLAKVLVTAAAVLAAAVPVIGALVVPSHSQVRDFISELGAVGTPWGQVVSLGGFLPTGVFSLAFLAVAAPLVAPHAAARVGYILLSCVGLAYVGAAFAPCDPGCPAFPSSLRQGVHNLLGASDYVGGGIGLLLFASTYFVRRPDRSAQVFLLVSGGVVLAVFQGMITPGLAAWHGAIQRVGEAALFGSLVLIGWRLTPAKRL